MPTSTKKTFSAKEIQRQLGHNRYHPIWHMAHKFRQAMGKGYFSTETPEAEKDKPLKRGRGSQRKAKCCLWRKVKWLNRPQGGKNHAGSDT